MENVVWRQFKYIMIQKIKFFIETPSKTDIKHILYRIQRRDSMLKIRELLVNISLILMKVGTLDLIIIGSSIITDVKHQPNINNVIWLWNIIQIISILL